MRKLVVGSIVLMLVTFGWGARSFGQEALAPSGELRIVDTAPENWISMTFNVMEHLLEFAPDGALVPRLATGWRWLDDRTLEVTLRQGVRFHNGEVFDAASVKLNWEENTRLEQPLILGKFMNFTLGSRLEIIDPYTVRFVLPEPDSGLLAKLSMLHIASASSIATSAGARRAGEFSMALARGAPGRISWWKASPFQTNVPTASSWKPIWITGI